MAVVAPPGASAPSVAGGRGARRLHPRQVARLADVVCRGRPDGSRAEPVAEHQRLIFISDFDEHDRGACRRGHLAAHWPHALVIGSGRPGSLDEHTSTLLTLMCISYPIFCLL